MNLASRISWEARQPTNRRTISTPTLELIGHHTVGLYRGAVGMRQMQNFHMDRRGWWDIAYSFVLDSEDYTLYEGRGAGVSGSHTPGKNSVAHAIAVTGNYMVRPVTDDLFNTLSKTVAWGREEGYWTEAFTSGHRDHSATSCPGDNLYAVLGDITAESYKVKPEKPVPQDPVPAVGWLDLVLGGHRLVRRNSPHRNSNRRVQSLLAAHGFPAANTFSSRGVPDGIAGAGTENAIRSFQSKKGLLIDGVVGIRTLSELVPSPWRLVSRTHNPGRINVRVAQALLAAANVPPENTFRNGVPDGIWGNGSHTACRTFQRRYNIAVDGIVGRQTITKVFTI